MRKEAVIEAAGVWGAVQMLKEQQTAFQWEIKAGISEGTRVFLTLVFEHFTLGLIFKQGFHF